MPRTTDVAQNETVKVVIDGAFVTSTMGAPMVVRINGEDVTVPAGSGVTVELVSPLNWPPIPGDVWTGGDSKPWFCKKDPIDSDPNRLRMYVYDNSAGPVGLQTWKTAQRPVTLAYRAAIPGG